MRLTYRQAIQKSIYDAMEEDRNVVFFGEDDRNNLYGYTDDLYEAFGEDRVIDIPLSEAGVVGTACGAAICGLRPVVDLTIENFLYVGMDQICSIAAKTSYMYDGAFCVPITIFTSAMSIGGNAAQHSDRLHSLFMNVPGLKIITPASPQDMYSMLREAVRDNNPVLCFADRSLFWTDEDVDTEKRVKLGTSARVSNGDDITIVAVSGARKFVVEIGEELKKRQINADVIDIRSIVPFDFETVKRSVMRTGKVVICDTACRTGSMAGHISSLLARNAFEYLRAPIGIATADDIPVPYAKELEAEVILSKDKIYREIDAVLSFDKGED